MIYTVYRTTNLVNTKFYIGVHKTEIPNDKYLGSGVIIRRAIMKYKTTSFHKEVLFQFETPEEAYHKEVELIAQEKENPLCYNIHPGGYKDVGTEISRVMKGMKRNPLSPEHRRAISIALKGKTHSAEWNSNIRKAKRGKNILSPEARKRQALSLSKTIRGEKNPNFGHRWSFEARQKASDRTKGKTTPKIVCEKCGKLIGIKVFVRHQTGPYSCVRTNGKRKVICPLCGLNTRASDLRRHQQTKKCLLQQPFS